MDSFDRFVGVVRTLLSENGCPWDRAQTHESLKPCLLEECYEVIDAIDSDNTENLKEELGDVLLQVVFHSILAQNEGKFTLDDTINGISDKMISRHPHIFGGESAENLVDRWEEIKKREKGYSTRTDAMRSVAKALPALVRGQKVIKKSMAQKQENITPVFEAAEECLKNLKQAENGNKDIQMELIGKLLMQILNISNFFEINAEFSLTNALETYINRIEDFENMSAAVGKSDEDTGLEDADIFIRSL
ncbi:MAG: nucleoside triphosphate pyrophosphohydrolase [Firmicutes bacterium]|nr:nucleoside triphosphate pyrophosphohydrolase [Bacillota bacterium]